MNKRFGVLKGLLVLAMAIIAGRLFVVQILEHDQWVARAEIQHNLENTLLAKRGQIYMLDGGQPVEVVMNETVYTVIVDPMLVKREKTEAVLEENAKEYLVAKWEDVLKDEKRRYYIVARNVPYEQAQKINETGLVGVWMQRDTQRVYPEGEMASGLLGFVNMDGEGQYGVEQAFNEQLAGKNGLLKAVKDINGVALSIGGENVLIPAQDGENVVLTVDKNIQFNLEKLLAEHKAKYAKGTRVSAVVMNPNNGEILAMANLPNYDPAKYSQVKDATAYINYTTEQPYEPASVVKAFTFATAINEGVMTPDSTYYNKGFVEEAGKTIKNAYSGKLGQISMQTALAYSLNTGSVQALKWLGGDGNKINKAGMQKMYEYFSDRFGFGRETGVELRESSGYLPSPDSGYAMNLTYANMTFGQGLNLTMLQTAVAFSAVVNGGKYYQPTILAGKVEDEKFTKIEREVKPERQVISEQSSTTMRQMLRGTRNLQRIYGIDKAGYDIGGKTGTAQVVVQKKDGTWGYSEVDGYDETIASYVGFGGTEGELPDFVIMVKIWGEGLYFGGEGDAEPMFNKISSFLIDYLRIKPKG